MSFDIFWLVTFASLPFSTFIQIHAAILTIDPKMLHAGESSEASSLLNHISDEAPDWLWDIGVEV